MRGSPNLAGGAGHFGFACQEVDRLGPNAGRLGEAFRGAPARWWTSSATLPGGAT